MSEFKLTTNADPGPAGIDFEVAHLTLEGWSSDWSAAPKGNEQKFLVRLKDGDVTTAYFYWYTEGEDMPLVSAGYYSLQDIIRDEPLDEDGPPELNGLMWAPMPLGSSGALTNFQKVGEFNRRFELPVADDKQPEVIDKHAFEFRSDFIREEHAELVQAHHDRDLVGVADALGDLLYVVYGMAHFYGIPIDEVFDAIHRKNMTKVRATDPSASKRGTALDVVKPVGFVGPEEDIRQILEDHANGR